VTDLTNHEQEHQHQKVCELAHQEAIKPFDLTQELLLRAQLLRLNNTEFVLLYTLHHIVSDGWSVGVLTNEINALYNAYAQQLPNPLAELEIQFSDYAHWERQRAGQGSLDAQLDYWQHQLAGLPQAHSLPLDKPRTSVQTYQGGTVVNHIDRSVVDAFSKLCQIRGTTLFMGLHASFSLLLSVYSGEKDIVVGTSIANREHPGVGSLIGFFLNTLVLRTDCSGNPSFVDFLMQVKSTNLDAQANQDVPFEHLVERINPERSTNHTPLMQVMFSMNTNDETALELDDLTLSPLEGSGQTVAKFELTLNAAETDDGLYLDFVYNTDLFDAATIKNLSSHLICLLDGIVANPQNRIDELPLLSVDEQQHLVVGLNDTKVEYDDSWCIHELFEQQVRRSPETIAVTYSNQQISYKQLNEKANQLAHYLREQGVKPGVLVGLCINRSIEMVTTILAILKAGGAYVPIDPNYPQSRVDYMVKDSGIKLILTGSGLKVNGYSTTDLPRLESQNPQNLAYVIYTSGSTGQPKGVLTEHRAVTAFAAKNQYINIDEVKAVLALSPVVFDGSVFDLFVPLTHGKTTVLVPTDEVTNSRYWQQQIDQHGVNAVFMTTALFNQLCTDALPVLQQFEQVLFGGELANPLAVQRFISSANNTKLVHVYGPTETTVYSTSTLITEDLVEHMPIGKPINNKTHYVLNASLQLTPFGAVGELYIGGAGLARGYLNQAEMTAKHFISDPFGEQADARLYKTGDLVRYLPDGNLVFMGRVDHQVKIRGLRIELGEIEHQLLQLSAVEFAVVLVREDEAGNKQLVAYVVGDGIEPTSIRESLQENLPQYMVPSFFVKLDALPLNANGKIDKKALPAPDASVLVGDYIAPTTPTQAKLVQIWSELLNIKPDKISISANFFEAGGHSLLSVRLVGEVRSQFTVELSIRDIFESPQLSALATRIEQADGQFNRPDLIAIERTSDRLPASFAQQRLWFIDQMDGGSSQYNMPGALRFNGSLDEAIVEQAFARIIMRHEPLRTVFTNSENGVLQCIRERVDFKLNRVDLTALSSEAQELALSKAVKEDARQTFDLQNDLMLRASLIRLSEDEGALLFNLHHIASDGWSIGVLMNELASHYQAILAGSDTPMSPLPIQYADYAQWQQNYLQGDVLDSHINYWKDRLNDAPQVHSLPLDRPRTAKELASTGHYNSRLGSGLSSQLNTLSLSHGATLFMTLQAAFSLHLGRWSRETDIVIGSPTAGRGHKSLEGLIGLFLNTQVFRTQFDDNPHFVELLERTRQDHISAHEYNELPFEVLVDKLNPVRSLTHSPIFQVLINMNNIDSGGVESAMDEPAMTDIKLCSLSDKNQSSSNENNYENKYDITLYINEVVANGETSIQFDWVYNGQLFDAGTVEMVAEEFALLLQSIADQPQLPVLEHSWSCANAWRVPVVEAATGNVVELFERQAQQKPAQVALSQNGQVLSYDQLNQKANQLARFLSAEYDIGLGSRVAIASERSFDRITAIWAALKLGAAYVPITAELPNERLNCILEDSKATVLVTDLASVDWVNRLAKPQFTLVVDNEGVKQGCSILSGENLSTSGINDDTLAHIIYTSGSTGRPKGVLGTHGASFNRISWMHERFAFDEGEQAAHLTSMAFIRGVWELFVPLCAGVPMTLIERDVVKDPSRLMPLIEREKISRIVTAPSLLRAICEYGYKPLTSLRYWFVSGEALPTDLAKQAIAAFKDTQFFNLYGSTEVLSDVLYTEVNPQETASFIPLGKPISQVAVTVVDRQGSPVPDGVLGELVVAGKSVVGGYDGLEALTKTQFIDTPAGRGYRTGDLARVRPDGQIGYVGRADFQLKIRGYRIELGDIETRLMQVDWVSAAVVVAQGDEPEDKRLVAYVAGGVAGDGSK
ncbi:MAG: amino acid adenylation domain-containing protein, partial [Psychrosphaera sp.]|nr:amino acid adenylation domain-containing protein [Psychrosphaera sp.]